MIEKLAEIITGYFVHQGVVTEEDKDIYVYGMDILLGTVTNCVLVTLISILVGQPISAIGLQYGLLGGKGMHMRMGTG